MDHSVRGIRIQIATRHNPLPMEDGAGNYVWSIITYLKEKGFVVEVVWVKAEGWLIRRGFWLIPKRFAREMDLHIIGEMAIGRLRLFPDIWWLPFKARSLDAVKKILCRLGLRSFFQKPGKRSQENTPLASGNYLPWNSPPSGSETAFFKKRFNSFRPDAVIVNYAWMSPLLDGSMGMDRVLKICITHDVQHIRCKMLAEAGAGTKEVFFTKEDEKGLLSPIDIMAAITDSDRDIFRSMLPEKNVVTVLKAVELHAKRGEVVPDRCLFVGGFAKTNIDGLSWFLEKIWPNIIKARPKTELHVCGNVCKSFDAQYPNVKFLGRLEDLENEYEEASVVVVPLLCASGLNIKLVEAFSFGKACVTTTAGIERWPPMGDAVICGNAPEEFADAVVRLLRDPELRKNYERKSVAFARSHLSKEGCYQPLADAILKQVRGN